MQRKSNSILSDALKSAPQSTEEEQFIEGEIVEQHEYGTTETAQSEVLLFATLEVDKTGVDGLLICHI